MSKKQKFIAIVNAQISAIEGLLAHYPLNVVNHRCALHVIDSALRVPEDKIPEDRNDLRKSAAEFVIDMYCQAIPGFNYINKNEL